MQASRMLLLCLLIGWAVGQPKAQSQATPVDRHFYQITSGTYTMVGGIWGTLGQRLPSQNQAFVLLKTNAVLEQVELTILGEDQETVALRLTNGVVSGNVIHFLQRAPHPYPHIETSGTSDYTVTNAAGTLRMNGSLSFPPLGPDIPTYYGHTNVEAMLMPVLQSRVSEVELQWSSQADRTYQVQYRSVLTSNLWMDLGPTISGSSPTTASFDKVPAGEPQRFYRVMIVP